MGLSFGNTSCPRSHANLLGGTGSEVIRTFAREVIFSGLGASWMNFVSSNVRRVVRPL